MATRKKPEASAGTANGPAAASYEHKQAEALIRPEVGVQSRFKKRKPPARYAYDPSLAPTMQWDAGNPARERGEALIARIEDAATRLAKLAADAELAERERLAAELRDASAALKALSRPFLEWAGKAERLSFEVPTLPLFIHERLSTQAILESLKGYTGGQMALDFGGHPDRDLAEQLLKAYEYPNGWFNRMILGDSLVVMNSLLQYEHLAGQVQMIYIDPPYGVKFGSNFQPFVRKRDVSHGADEDLTREPEMVKAYRDTWELGLHSYLTYLRDRLLVSRDLLTDSGSVFVQISDENLHHVREVMDEVFGAENFVALIPFRKKTMPLGAVYLEQMGDFLIWYGKFASEAAGRRTKVRKLFVQKDVRGDQDWRWYLDSEGRAHQMTAEQHRTHFGLPDGARIFRLKSLEPSGPMKDGMFSYSLGGKTYKHPKNGYGTTFEGMKKLEAASRLQPKGELLNYRLFLDDYPVAALTAPWSDTVGADNKAYVVQTNTEVLRRCILMTTDPGDLVLDPTCGSGTTAYVAEQWGRRWITIDASRVPLALARQRLLTACFDYQELKSPERGPAGGFEYRMRKNRRGEQDGGVVPHVTLGSITNGDSPDIEILVDRPAVVPGITRVTGPFVFEATIPTAQGFDDATPEAAATDETDDAFIDRMVGVLQASPVLHLPGNQTVSLAQVRRPARALWLSAEAVRGEDEPVAILFGPAHGSVTRRLVEEAWGEAQLPGRGYQHLYVIGFAIEPDARQRIDDYYTKLGLPVTYVQATPDVLMGDLLKNMRSSQIFSVCGQPDVSLTPAEPPSDGASNAQYWQVKLEGLDVFDPATDRVEPTPGREVPAWFLDTDYNGLVFRPRQAFFPLTGAWDNLKRSLRAEFDDSVWAHLAGDTSEPFIGGPNDQIAVKVIDHRGNELMVVKALTPPKKNKR